MKKTLLLFSLTSLIIAGTVHAQTFLNEDFNSVSTPALPANWASIPASQWKGGNPDNLIPNSQYTLASPDHLSTASIDGAATSANGAVLATPVISLPSSATTAGLFFDKAYFQYQLTNDPTKAEKLTLVVSTDGGTSWTDVNEISPNQNFIWETNYISIGTYAGQSNLKFGFKYENNGGALVGASIDNIKVSMGADLALSAAQAGSPGSDGGYQTVGTGAVIAGSVYNAGTTTITDYVVKYQEGSNAPVAYSVSGANIAPLGNASFTHATPYNVATATAYPIKVWVELANDITATNDTINIKVTGVPFMPSKKLVFEEGTGAWCGFCPRGTKGMDDFANENPGMATQIAVHNTAQGPDAMAYPAYVNFLNSYMSGYPSIVVDRIVQDDPSNIAPLYSALKDNFGFADITMGATNVSGTSVTIPVTVKPAVDIAGAKLALVVTESNLSGTGSGWDQHNYYSDAFAQDQGTLGGGWDEQPETVAGLKYHFVARGISPSPGGAASGLPASMTAGSDNQATLTATLDASWKPENLQYIVLLIGADGTILNSNFTPLPTLEAVLPGGVAVTNVSAGIEEASLYPNPTNSEAYLQVKIKDAAASTLTITDVVGRSVGSPVITALQSGRNTIKIPTQNLATGMYLLNLTTNKGNVSLKLQVIK